jgi:hypothetical protein
MPQASASLHNDVLNSGVLPIIHSTYGSYLLPQAFPEGSPTHPCYPTGHGTVGGACITALKFFFDGSQKIRPLLTSAGRDVYVPSEDGLSLEIYPGPDGDILDVNGELNKLATTSRSDTGFMQVYIFAARPIGQSFWVSRLH